MDFINTTYNFGCMKFNTVPYAFLYDEKYHNSLITARNTLNINIEYETGNNVFSPLPPPKKKTFIVQRLCLQLNFSCLWLSPSNSYLPINYSMSSFLYSDNFKDRFYCTYFGGTVFYSDQQKRAFNFILS